MKAEKLEGGAQAEAFRERIMQASVELIREQGLGALSMREVARRAGVSHQAPYHYFTDRQAILSAIAEQGFDMLRARVREGTEDRSGPLLQRIMRAGEAYIMFAFEQREHFRMMFRPELVNMADYPGLKNAGNRACDIFYEVVCETVEAGLPADVSVESLFALCWSVGHGFACLAIDGPLDVVMPGMDRAQQMRDLLKTFALMMEARVAQAKPKPVVTIGKRAAKPKSAPKRATKSAR